jgi:hypothetical protein
MDSVKQEENFSKPIRRQVIRQNYKIPFVVGLLPERSHEGGPCIAAAGRSLSDDCFMIRLKYGHVPRVQ